jgi:acyl-CoA synthetase (NDP forming)
LLASPSYDALTIIVGSSGVAQPELMAGAIQDCLPLSDKPVLAYISPHAPQATAILTQSGVPAFMSAESCAAAFDGMLHVQQWQAGHASHAGSSSTSTLQAAPVDTSDLPTGSLNEAQAKQLFSRFGVPCTREREVSTAAQAEQAAQNLGGLVVLKLLSSTVTHKSDVGGVAVGVRAEEIGARLERMRHDVERALALADLLRILRRHRLGQRRSSAGLSA